MRERERLARRWYDFETETKRGFHRSASNVAFRAITLEAHLAASPWQAKNNEKHDFVQYGCKLRQRAVHIGENQFSLWNSVAMKMPSLSVLGKATESATWKGKHVQNRRMMATTNLRAKKWYCNWTGIRKRWIKHARPRSSCTYPKKWLSLLETWAKSAS